MRPSSRRSGVLVLFCWLVLAAGSRSLANATAAKGDLQVSSRIVMGITLGRSNLAAVEKRLGPAKAWSEGDASTAEHLLCYVTTGPNPMAIVFASNSEMAGPPENQVTDIRIMSSDAYPERSRCGTLAVSGNDIGTPSGLKAGISRDRVREILGTPSRRTPTSWTYSWSVDRPLPTSDKNYQYWLSRKEECFNGRPPFFTVDSEINVLFDGGVATVLRFERIESVC